MKIRFASDLHLEIAYDDPSFVKPKDSAEVKFKRFSEYADELLPPLEGDDETILLLAGDICENWRAHTRYHGFWSRVGERFSMVFWIPGNHEYYGHKFSDMHDQRIRDNMIREYDNVYYWNRERVTLKEGDRNIHIIGATLWSDIDNFNPLVEFQVSQALNDYRHITNADVEKDIYRKLRVSDTTNAWKRDKAFLSHTVNMFKHHDPNSVVIVFTHHAPCFLSIPERYKDDPISHAYASSNKLLDAMPLLPDIWIHGHIHDSNAYEIGDMKVVSNPSGYHDHHPNQMYDYHKTIEITETTCEISSADAGRIRGLSVDAGESVPSDGFSATCICD